MHYLLKPLIRKGFNKTTLSWALYDWANSAFATVVLAGFFPILFKDYWGNQLADTRISLILGIAASLSGLLLVLAAPVIGYLADLKAVKKPYLALCIVIGSVATIAFAFIGEGAWQTAIVCYVLSVFMFMAGNVFYDALLVNVTSPTYYNRISSAGFALGYLGGGIALILSVLVIWQSGIEKMQDTFAGIGLWWLLFSIPLFIMGKRETQTQITFFRLSKTT